MIIWLVFVGFGSRKTSLYYYCLDFKYASFKMFLLPGDIQHTDSFFPFFSMKLTGFAEKTVVGQDRPSKYNNGRQFHSDHLRLWLLQASIARCCGECCYFPSLAVSVCVTELRLFRLLWASDWEGRGLGEGGGCSSLKEQAATISGTHTHTQTDNLLKGDQRGLPPTLNAALAYASELH